MTALLKYTQHFIADLNQSTITPTDSLKLQILDKCLKIKSNRPNGTREEILKNGLSTRTFSKLGNDTVFKLRRRYKFKIKKKMKEAKQKKRREA